MKQPAKQALICWFSALVLIVAALRLILGAPTTPDGAGEAIGRVFANTGLAALAAWMIARKKTPPWSWPRFIVVYFAAVVIIAIVASAGRTARASEPDIPFAASFPEEWSVERLQGVSSAPMDQERGIRERARWDGADGASIIELTCSWLAPRDAPDLAEQLNRIANGLKSALSEQGLSVEAGGVKKAVIGKQPGLSVILRASRKNQTAFVQEIAVALSSRCFLSATFSGTPRAFELQLPTFVNVLGAMRFD